MRYFLYGFVPGLFVGAAVALLLSPGKGPENREFVRRRFQDAVESGRESGRAQEAQLRAQYRRNIGAPEPEQP
jgi:gas vesicle protein